MKTFKIIAFLAIFSGHFAYCQQKSQRPDSIDASDLKHPGAIKGDKVFINDKNLDKYLGTWVWQGNTQSITISFSKKLMHYGGNNHVLDAMILVGTYRYLKDGKQISPDDYALTGSSGGKQDTINLFMSDNARKKSITLMAIYLNAKSIKIELDDKQFEFKNDKEFLFPSRMMLTKEK